jgi:nicotinamide-nucleotide amidase
MLIEFSRDTGDQSRGLKTFPDENPMSIASDHDVEQLLKSIRQRLVTKNERLVLAESCTAGLVASLLGRCPGISDVFCGSFVVYRNASKTTWLGIDPSLLEDPKIGPVSAEVTSRLSQAILKQTPEASIAAAITGHLGPNAPPDFDGLVFTQIVHRLAPNSPRANRLRLSEPAPIDDTELHRRYQRQRSAAWHLLCEIDDFLT